jgi:hypothetical protein
MNAMEKNRGYRLTAIMLVVVLLSCAAVRAQDTSADGEFCVRAFEDTNANRVRDLNEPPLQRGISANLLDVNGVVVASALLDNSPQAARGLICFQFLPPGQYTIEVSSADYTPTLGSVMTNVVQAGEVPYVMEYGATRLGAAVGASNTPQTEVNVEGAVPRIALSLAGAAAAMFIMSLLGMVIYLVAYLPRLRRASATPIDDTYRRPPTGTMPRVTDTAEVRKR